MVVSVEIQKREKERKENPRFLIINYFFLFESFLDFNVVLELGLVEVVGSNHLSTYLVRLLICDFMKESLISYTVFVSIWLWDIVIGDRIVLFLFNPSIWFYIYLLNMNPNSVCLCLLDMSSNFIYFYLLDMNSNSIYLYLLDMNLKFHFYLLDMNSNYAYISSFYGFAFVSVSFL